MTSPLFDPKVDELSTLLEEGARASDRTVTRFIEPMQGTLRRAKTKRHHLVFGRRGSGKSSLLYKSEDALSTDGFPVAYVDLEPFKGHHYPDVLISVLLSTFSKLRSWVVARPARKGRMDWRWLWLRRRKDPSREQVIRMVDAEVEDLSAQLHLVDDSSMVSKTAGEDRTRDSGTAKGTVKVGGTGLSSELETQIASEVQKASSREVTEEFRRSKTDYLHRKILAFRSALAGIVKMNGTDIYLFLDDLYHLSREDQALLLDYFHRIAKGSNLWLKIGTIRHRSSWYIHSPQPKGLKLGDDADDIDLDLTLEKFATTKKFLSQVLHSYIEEAKAPTRAKLLSDGALDRLVIASGGVTRDFLQIFRRAIDEARDRLSKDPKHPRGEQISAEDVNMASGAYGDTKLQEFQKDTLEDEAKLKDAFEKIRIFCLEKNACNVFLMDQDITNEHTELVQELVDLRLVHHIRSRVTVRGEPGRTFRALLLDVSQYAGERKRKNFLMIEFWKEGRDILRKPSLIYDPTTSTEDLKRLAIGKESGAHEEPDSAGPLFG